jgi:hypothetical protein
MNENRPDQWRRQSPFASTAVQSTLAFDTLPGGRADGGGPASTVSSSLLLDLQRITLDAEASELLAVCAASVRHTKPLVLKVLLGGDHPYDIALDPGLSVYRCAVDICALPDQLLGNMQLVEVQPGEPDAEGKAGLRAGSLRPMLWHLAVRGPVDHLLAEIAGPVRCRVALGTPLNGLPLDGSRKRLIDRMKFAPISVDDLMGASGLSRVAVQRVWNALYLQSALMVTRPIRGG